MLRVALHSRKTAIVAALSVIPLMVVLYGRSQSGLLPNMDEGTFILDYFLPEGTSLDDTDRLASKIEDLLRDDKYHVAAYTRRTGAENGFFATQMFHGDFTVVLADRRDRPPITEIMEDVQPTRARVSLGANRDDPSDAGRVERFGGAAKPIEIKIFGPDMKELRDWPSRPAKSWNLKKSRMPD